ncbi:MAG TPA: hypothetical protein VEZ20_03530 [Allosphingosinicella sp.]|nr:hypothetical protein [Allosphingosinicella sp.]
MTRAQFRNFVAASLLAAGASALAPQADPAPPPPASAPATPDPAGDPAIVVTGERPTDLVVDVERIARRCAACRRALERLRADAARNQVASARTRVDSDEPLHGNHWGRGVTQKEAAADMHQEALRGQREASIRASRALDRAQTPDRARQFSANLLRLIDPIVERILLERGAEAVFAPRDPAARGRALPDITAAVIEALDREHSQADLLADVF